VCNLGVWPEEFWPRERREILGVWLEKFLFGEGGSRMGESHV